MSGTVTFSCELPVLGEYDVFIAGGGPAGTAAAWAAARCGARVFLAERSGCFGGMGTAGLVPAFAGVSDGQQLTCGGFGAALFEEMRRADGFGNRNYAIRPEILKRVYDCMMTDSGIDFVFEADLIGVNRNGSRLTEAVIHTVAGPGAVRAAVFIDATGDGILGALAGADFELGDPAGRIMPSSLCSLWSNIDWQAWRDSGAAIFDILKTAIEDGGYFEQPDWHHTGMAPAGETTACGNFGHIFGLDPTDFRARTRGWIEGRRLLPEFQRFYRERVPGFGRCELSASASALGIREGRRLVGDYRMVRDDYGSRRVFPDSIGVYHYDIDIHPYDNSLAEFQRFRRDFCEPANILAPGECCTIPYRSLCVKNCENLLAAGRCIAADHDVEAAIRVMPVCFVTGQAAGCAAALARTDGDIRQIPVTVLQQQLTDLGARLRP
ncbi:MAG: FAD-dependent oxidoreductase [Lentisphaeria bacterium]|nr:FAD-dependent oxidoreductase [Lentisphaeria bacterium]